MSLELFHHSRHKKSRNLNLEIIPLSSHFLSLVSEHLKGGKPIPQMCGKMQDSLRTGLELVPEPKALCSRCVQRDSHPQALLPGLLAGRPGVLGSRCAAAQLRSNSRGVLEVGKTGNGVFF